MDSYRELAVEALESRGLRGEKVDFGTGCTVVHHHVTKEGEVRERGHYFAVQPEEGFWADTKERKRAGDTVARCLQRLMGISKLHPKRVLVAGLGNPSYTADALGDATVATLSPTDRRKLVRCGVEACTGIPTADVLAGIVRTQKIELVVAVDSLACANPRALAANIQLSDAGIRPGGGLGMQRKAVNRTTLGVDVLYVGVPLISYVDAYADQLCVTPRDINSMIEYMSAMLARAIGQVVR